MGDSRRAGGQVVIERRLAARPPYPLRDVLEFLGARAVPGTEAWSGSTYVRTLSLANGHGVLTVDAPADDALGDDVAVELRLQDGRDADDALARTRRLLDLDTDPAAVSAVLGADEALAPLVEADPGRRVPGSVDPFETAVRAIVGQQVSVAGARTVTGRIVAALGAPLDLDGGGLVDRLFPTPDALAGADDAVFSMPRRRAATIRAVAAGVLGGDLDLTPGIDRAHLRDRLLAVPGIGPWTADYIAMRGLGDPDVFLPTDLGVRAGLARLGLDGDRAERWRPWRSYALHYLWAAVATTTPVSASAIGVGAEVRR